MKEGLIIEGQDQTVIIMPDTMDKIVVYAPVDDWKPNRETIRELGRLTPEQQVIKLNSHMPYSPGNSSNNLVAFSEDLVRQILVNHEIVWQNEEYFPDTVYSENVAGRGIVELHLVAGDLDKIVSFNSNLYQKK